MASERALSQFFRQLEIAFRLRCIERTNRRRGQNTQKVEPLVGGKRGRQYFSAAPVMRGEERGILPIYCVVGKPFLRQYFRDGMERRLSFQRGRSIHDLKDKVQSCISFKSQSHCSLQAYVTWFAVSNFFVPFAVLLFCYRCEHSSHFQGLLKAASSEEQWSLGS